MLKNKRMNDLKTIIKKHEGLSLFPYVCPAGKWTIGVGRNLQENGISYNEAIYLLENDIRRAMDELSRFSWFLRLDTIRQGVLIELNFNIGLPGVLSFEKMIDAIAKKAYELASAELLDSLWAKQVGPNRSNHMANRLLTGRYEEE